jgi:hypothetical protein
MKLCALDEVRLHLVERYAFFVPPRPGDQHVLDVFPKRFVFLEVDYRRRLAAFSSVMNWIPVIVEAVSSDGGEPVFTLISIPRVVNRIVSG